MILLDGNILLYAFISGSTQHAKIKEWLESAIGNDHEPLAVSWTTILAFIRIATNSKVYRPALRIEEISETLQPFLQHRNVRILHPLDDHFSRLIEVMIKGQATAALTMDAHLAALAMEYGAKIATTDRDFLRFRGVKTIDPLED